MDQGSQVVATEPIEILEDVTAPRRESDITAWVNVIHGCNEKCTYCVVPNTRGFEQSRRPENIRVSIAWAAALVMIMHGQVYQAVSCLCNELACSLLLLWLEPETCFRAGFSLRLHGNSFEQRLADGHITRPVSALHMHVIGTQSDRF